eukprot:6014214-Pleurochrysis_carterae.AAC.1
MIVELPTGKAASAFIGHMKLFKLMLRRDVMTHISLSSCRAGGHAASFSSAFLVNELRNLHQLTCPRLLPAFLRHAAALPRTTPRSRK